MKKGLNYYNYKFKVFRYIEFENALEPDFYDIL